MDQPEASSSSPPNNRNLRKRVRKLASEHDARKNKFTLQEIDGEMYLKRRNGIEPFGYRFSEVHEGWLKPIPLELAALERARQFILNDATYEDVADWIFQVTGRDISALGLWKALRRGY